MTDWSASPHGLRIEQWSNTRPRCILSLAVYLSIVSKMKLAFMVQLLRVSFFSLLSSHFTE